MSSVVYSGQKVFRPVRRSLSRGDPAQEPVGLEEMKDHSRIDSADDDATISGLISAARRWVEIFTQRALITQAYVMKVSEFPALTTTVIELPGGNTQSVTSIAYLDTDGNSQTWASSNYITDLVAEPALIGLAYDIDWPTIRAWDLPITITYVAGYGDNPGDVPEELRSAIKMIAGDLYLNREDSVIGSTVNTVSWPAQRLADPYRVHRVI